MTGPGEIGQHDRAAPIGGFVRHDDLFVIELVEAFVDLRREPGERCRLSVPPHRSGHHELRRHPARDQRLAQHSRLLLTCR
jgi:hypothetical protein